MILKSIIQPNNQLIIHNTQMKRFMYKIFVLYQETNVFSCPI